jgi:hypothetical protein
VKIKRLSLTNWQKTVCSCKFKPEKMAEGLIETLPTFKKIGWYLVRLKYKQISWFEDGKRSWTTPNLSGEFAVQLEMLNHAPLRKNVVEAMKILSNNGFTKYDKTLSLDSGFK